MRVASILLLLILFVILVLGPSRFWWKRGTGYSVYKQLDEAGIKNEEALQAESNKEIVCNAKQYARRYGLIYAALMVNGVHIPLFGLILVTTGTIVGFGSKKIGDI